MTNIRNPHFNSLEFEGIRNEAGRNSFFVSVKGWIDRSGAKGEFASPGRYAEFIHMAISQTDRLWRLNQIAIRQMQVLTGTGVVRRLPGTAEGER